METDIITALREQNYNIIDTDIQTTKLIPVGDGYNLVIYLLKSPKFWEYEKEGARTKEASETATIEAEKFISVFQRIKLDLNDGIFIQSKQDDYHEGGYEKIKETHTIIDAPYEEVGPQKKAILPKPGRRIKNQEAEMMEGGKIRAGKKVLSNNGKPIPKKTEYFTITNMNRKTPTDPNDPDSGFERDEYIHQIVGEKPTRLKVRLACDREDLNFVTYFGKYASASCECRGDGGTAQKFNGDIIPCPGEECESFKKGECKRHGVLSVILEDAPRCGVVYKLRTTSRNSINNLTASLALLTMCSNGHIAGLPLWLTLTPKETIIPTTGKRTVIYMANLEYRGNFVSMQEHLQQLITERNGRDPVREIERVLEASLALPESPDECKEIHDEFHPDSAEVA